jgi:hypothetical protein
MEPKFHVSKKTFDLMVDKLESFGFKVVKRPKVFFSRAIVLEN